MKRKTSDWAIAIQLFVMGFVGLKIMLENETIWVCVLAGTAAGLFIFLTFYFLVAANDKQFKEQNEEIEALKKEIDTMKKLLNKN